MATEEKLPWELTEEILSRVPPESLVSFRTVSKRWNALFNEKRFIKNHKSTFRFILRTNSHTYSVSIDPEIVVRELTLDITCLESPSPKSVVDCGGFLLCSMTKAGVALWNPWLNQSRWIKADPSELRLRIDGIGYDNRRDGEKVYKTLASYWKELDDPSYNKWWKVHDLASDAWKEQKGLRTDPKNYEDDTLFTRFGVSLNGDLYWVAFHDKKDTFYHLTKFDFSKESFVMFCDLPCGRKHPLDAIALGVFKEDRFSLFKQCHITKKIEIWVTKNKINVDDGKDVVWMSIMSFSIPNFPSLVHDEFQPQPSYLIEDKRLVVCCCDETGLSWVYVVGDNNKLISKTRLKNVVEPWPFHCTYFPSLVPVPRGPREEAGVQV